MRIQLACMDWVINCLVAFMLEVLFASRCMNIFKVHFFPFNNENVNRETFCEVLRPYSRGPDREAPYRILRPKTFIFRDRIWEKFFSKAL